MRFVTQIGSGACTPLVRRQVPARPLDTGCLFQIKTTDRTAVGVVEVGSALRPFGCLVSSYCERRHIIDRTATRCLYRTEEAYSSAVTKTGVFIYDGNPQDYREWEFRTELRIAAFEQKCRRDRRKKKDESFSSSSKPETGKRERTPKAASTVPDLERGWVLPHWDNQADFES